MARLHSNSMYAKWNWFQITLYPEYLFKYYTAVIWLKYSRYRVKAYIINQSIKYYRLSMQAFPVHLGPIKYTLIWECTVKPNFVLCLLYDSEFDSRCNRAFKQSWPTKHFHGFKNTLIWIHISFKQGQGTRLFIRLGELIPKTLWIIRKASICCFTLT